MKKISRLFLFGALMLMLLTAACAGQQGLPTATAQATSTATTTETPTATVSPTSTTTPTPTTTLTPGTPAVSLVCQFCIDTAAHAILAIPAAATFTILTPNASTACNTVETLNDKQVVLCQAPSNTLITLNVCAGSNCREFPVRLQTCPPLPVTTFTRTPTPTPTPSTTPTFTPPVSSPTSPTSTSTVGGPTSTPTVSPTPTPTTSPTATP